MTDSLLTDADIEEALSRVYVQAVAAMAGYVTEERLFDRDGVDLAIKAGEPMYPAIDLQLKATVNLGKKRNGYYRYPLKIRNFELLRISTQTPRLLVLLDLPKDQSQWLTITPDELVLRRSAYWLNLRRHDETKNRSSITVHIPEQNLFNVDNLHMLIEQSRQGSIQ